MRTRPILLVPSLALLAIASAALGGCTGSQAAEHTAPAASAPAAGAQPDAAKAAAAKTETCDCDH